MPLAFAGVGLAALTQQLRAWPNTIGRIPDENRFRCHPGSRGGTGNRGVLSNYLLPCSAFNRRESY